MPRYFFSVYDGHSEPDDEGTVLPDLECARNEAIRCAADILNDDAHRIALGEDWRMEVTDPSGRLLFKLVFHAVAGEL